MCGVKRKRSERGAWIDGQFWHRACRSDQPGYTSLQARIRELEVEVERLQLNERIIKRVLEWCDNLLGYPEGKADWRAAVRWLKDQIQIHKEGGHI